MRELARVLPPNLVELDLTGNEMGPEGLRALARVVKTHPLKELRSRSRSLRSPKSGWETLRILLETWFRKLKSLETRV